MLFTACTDPQNPVENIKKKNYPESLTSQEKENVSAFSTEKLSDSLSSMENVIELLEIHKDEEGASENLSLIKDIYAAIKDSGVTELTNENPDVNAIIKGIEDNANAIQGDIITLDTSYTDENGVTQSYKNVDDYNAARDDAISKIDEYWDYAHGDYLTELNNYANAVDELYTNRPAYISVENYAKETVEDFKDNYIFNNSYDEKEIKTLVNNAKTEQENIQNGSSVAEQKAAYDNATATLSDYETSARNAVDAANNFELVKQDNTTTTPGNSENNNPENNNPENKDPENKDPENKDPENKDPENNDPENNDPENNDPTIKDPEITYTDATITDISQVTDWSKVGNVTVVATPDANGSVDVMSYYNLKKAVDDKIASLSDGHSRTVAFADYPATVKSFKIGNAEKSNVSMMQDIMNPDTDAITMEGQSIITEVIPGVELVTYAQEYYAKDDKTILQAFKITDSSKKIDLSGNVYELTGTYKSGVIGSAGFNNLSSTTYTGIIKGKEGLKSVYNNFVEKTSAEDLPTFCGVEFASLVVEKCAEDRSSGGSNFVNLYGSSVDLLIKKYYENDKHSKFSFNPGASVFFDAEEFLSGGVMYEENAYSNSAYDIDANAALLIGSVANVNIIGRNKLGITESSTRFMNTRIEADMGGVEFTSSVRGVLDIAGTQSGTLTLPSIYGRLIVRDGAVSSENSSISLYGGQQVDLSEVSEEDVAKISSRGDFYNHLNFKNENAATKTNVGATNKTFYGTDNRFGGVSAQQIVERANNGESLDSGISQLSPRKVAPTKSELLRAILDEIIV